MVDTRNAYLKTQVLTARPEQLTLMLFDGAIRFAEKGRKALEEKNYEGSFEALSRAEQIIMELINSLRPETHSELCRHQAGLYLFVYGRLVEANMNREPAALRDAIRILGILRETWAMLMTAIQEAPDADPPLAPARAPAALSLEG